jgi:hypothetical protein
MNNWLRHSKAFVKRNSSTILTCLGGVGVVATSVMAVKATPKALTLLEEAREEKGEDLTKVEKVMVAGPAYIPAVVTGVATVACIFGANILSKRQQAALTSAYALLDSSFKDYKKKVEELYGEDAHVNVVGEIAKDKYADDDILLEDEKELFYDEFSGRYFQSTKDKVRYAIYEINRDIHMRGWATLNEFYEYLDIPNVDGGECLGWSEGGNFERYWQSWVDFNYHPVTMDDGLEVTIISMFSEPYVDWEEY